MPNKATQVEAIVQGREAHTQNQGSARMYVVQLSAEHEVCIPKQHFHNILLTLAGPSCVFCFACMVPFKKSQCLLIYLKI